MQVKHLFTVDSWKLLLKSNGKYVKYFSYSTVASLLQQLPLPFIVLPFLSRKLSQSAFGELMIVLSIVSFVSVVSGSTIAMAIYRKHGDLSGEEKPSFLGSVIKMSLLVNVAVAIALVLLHRPLFERWDITFTLLWFLPLIVFSVLTSINSVLSTMISIDLRFSFLALTGGVYLISSVMIVVCYLLMPRGSWTVGFIFAPAVAGSLMLGSLIKKKKLNFRSSLNWGFFKEFFGLSLMFFMITMMANLLIYGDRWLLAEYGIAKSDIAVYSVAVQACVLFIVVVRQMSNVFTPIISNIKSYNDITSSQARKILAVTFASVLLVATLGSFGGFLYIRILFGKAYWLQSKTLFIIIFTGMALYPLQIFSRAFLIRFRSLWLSLSIYIVAAIIMLLTVHVLADRFDVKAFAFGRQFSFVWIAVVSFAIAQGQLIRRLSSTKLERFTQD